MDGNDDITADKVTFGFVLMAAAGRERFTNDEIAQTVVGLQGDCIASLLKDESGAARQRVAERLRELWAIYSEHSHLENPWE